MTNKFYRLTTAVQAKDMVHKGLRDVFMSQNKDNVGTQEIAFGILESLRLNVIKADERVVPLTALSPMHEVRNGNKAKYEGQVFDGDTAKAYRKAIRDTFAPKPENLMEGDTDRTRKDRDTWNRRKAAVETAIKLAETIVNVSGADYLWSEVSNCFQINASEMMPVDYSLALTALQVKNKTIDFQVDLDNKRLVRGVNETGREITKRCNYTNFVRAHTAKKENNSSKLDLEKACEFISKLTVSDDAITDELYEKVTSAAHVLTLFVRVYDKANPDKTTNKSRINEKLKTGTNG